jgi:alcohol dehydrogenase (cytochrome c)
MSHRIAAGVAISGSPDPTTPELDLVYFGTSQPKPWAAPSRGMSVEDAALYTNATLAVRPKTGELVWHFQHIPWRNHRYGSRFRTDTR